MVPCRHNSDIRSATKPETREVHNVLQRLTVYMIQQQKDRKKDGKATENSTEWWAYFDAIALPHGDSHGHGDWRDATNVQQGETETLAIFLCSYTGKTGEAPESKTTLTRKKETQNDSR